MGFVSKSEKNYDKDDLKSEASGGALWGWVIGLLVGIVGPHLNFYLFFGISGLGFVLLPALMRWIIDHHRDSLYDDRY